MTDCYLRRRSNLETFLRTLQGQEKPYALQSILRKRWGEDITEALLKDNVLRPGDRSETYPCPNAGKHCPRKVTHSTKTGFPFIAIPGDDFCCEPKLLRDEDLQTWVWVQRVWEELLGRLFKIKGSINGEDVFPNARRLGKSNWRGLARELIYVTDSGVHVLPHLLARCVCQRQTIAVIPARWRRYDIELDKRSGLDGPLEVIFLEDVLTLNNGYMSLEQSHVVTVDAAETPEYFCLMTDVHGETVIDKAKYAEVLSTRQDYDLFLNLLSPTSASRYQACRRDNGGFHENSLSNQQAWAYAELMRRRTPLRAAELKSLSTYGNPHKQIEAARRVLDVKTARTAWRSTRLLSGDDRQAKRYLFQPPEDLRWVLLMPLEESG